MLQSFAALVCVCVRQRVCSPACCAVTPRWDQGDAVSHKRFVFQCSAEQRGGGEDGGIRGNGGGRDVASSRNNGGGRGRLEALLAEAERLAAAVASGTRETEQVLQRIGAQIKSPPPPPPPPPPLLPQAERLSAGSPLPHRWERRSNLRPPAGGGGGAVRPRALTVTGLLGGDDSSSSD